MQVEELELLEWHERGRFSARGDLALARDARASALQATQRIDDGLFVSSQPCA